MTDKYTSGHQKAQPVPWPPASPPSTLLPKLSARSLPSAEDKNTPLHLACLRGAYTEALMLLLSGHSADARNAWRETPLHQAVARGHLNIVMLLLDAGSDVNAVDHQNPLHQAVIHANKDAAELVLSYGASVYNAEGVTDIVSALELAGHVHVCHKTVKEADGSSPHVVQHVHFSLPEVEGLRSLPVTKSKELHENWERVRTSKAEAVKKRGEARRARQGNSRYGSGLHLIRNS